MIRRHITNYTLKIIPLLSVVLLILLFYSGLLWAQSKPTINKAPDLNVIAIIGLALLQTLIELVKKFGWYQNPTDKKIEELYASLYLEKAGETLRDLRKDWQTEKIPDKICDIHKVVTDSLYRSRQEEITMLLDDIHTKSKEIHLVVTEKINGSHSIACKCCTLHQTPDWDNYEKNTNRLIDTMNAGAINEVRVIAVLESIVDKQRQIIKLLEK